MVICLSITAKCFLIITSTFRLLLSVADPKQASLKCQCTRQNDKNMLANYYLRCVNFMKNVTVTFSDLKHGSGVLVVSA